MKTSAMSALGLLLTLVVAVAPQRAWANGACCYPDTPGCTGSAPQASCQSSGGYWLGEGSACSPGICDTGACCERATPGHSNGSCDGFVTRAECEEQLCGKFVGKGSSCENVPGATCTSYFVNDPLPCDCNVDGQVTVDELINSVEIALFGCTGTCCTDGYGLHSNGTFVCTQYTYIPPCPAADWNHDGLVTINELVAGVASALDMCVSM